MSAPDNKFSAILSSVREPLHASSLTASKSLQCQRQLVEKQQETSESKSACLPKPCLESQPAPPEMNSSAVKVPSGQIAWHDSDKKGSCMNSLPDTSNSEFFMPLADDKSSIVPPNLYQTARDYWSSLPPNLNSMLGGYTQVDYVDVCESLNFLDLFGPPTHAYALDCGAGIGRVAKHLLLRRFARVDLVEMTKSFLDKAAEFLGSTNYARIGECFCVGLQEFTPPLGRYDLIWIQWVSCQLTDLALIKFLQRAARGLSQSGVIVIKENVTTDGSLQFDSQDGSYTRSREAILALVAATKCLVLVGEADQSGFPTSLYPVKMFALTKIDPARDDEKVDDMQLIRDSCVSQSVSVTLPCLGDSRNLCSNKDQTGNFNSSDLSEV